MGEMGVVFESIEEEEEKGKTEFVGEKEVDEGVEEKEEEEEEEGKEEMCVVKFPLPTTPAWQDWISAKGIMRYKRSGGGQRVRREGGDHGSEGAFEGSMLWS